jgi:hypothetical protein
VRRSSEGLALKFPLSSTSTKRIITQFQKEYPTYLR